MKQTAGLSLYFYFSLKCSNSITFASMKKAIVAVINDLVTDQRVHKSCLEISNAGFDVLLVGRQLKSSPKMDTRPYGSHRMKLLFTSGPLFYAFFNFRLFWFLLFHKSDLIVSNDLDTLLASFLVSKIKKVPLVYDSHEYFTEVPELEGRMAKKVWLSIEKFIFPKIEHIITVNNSIASIYQNLYNKELLVVRNMPLKLDFEIEKLTKTELKINPNNRIIILQGSGINQDRGGEEAVLAMKYVSRAVLLIVGGGDALPLLKKMVEEHQLQNKVLFIPRQTRKKLYAYTKLADIGLSLDKDSNLNYHFSLPNKIFDYIQCGTPVLASNLPEISRIINTYKIGQTIDEVCVESISSAINKMLDSNYKENHIENLNKAASELIWETDAAKIRNLYKKIHQS